MRKKIFLSVFFIALGGVFIFFALRQSGLQSRYPNLKMIDYRLKSNRYRLLVADTAEKWQRGLMFFRSLEGVDGMIFIFPDRQVRTFWNKNTFMDLDLYWIDRDKIVGKSFLPSIEKSKDIVFINSAKEVDKVMEIVKR